jgi:acetyl-CoA synthetase
MLYSLRKLERLSREAEARPAQFWGRMSSFLTWFKEPEAVLQGNPPKASWFVGGRLNVSYNALDRHLPQLSNRVAFYWENELGQSRTISYAELHGEVNRAAAVLRDMGVRKGDVVSMMMPSCPEAVIFGLAVHRLGGTLVIHYAGLEEGTLAYRLRDCGSKLFVVAAKGVRNNGEVRMKDLVDKSLAKDTPVEKVLVVSRGESDFQLRQGRDVVYEDVKPRGKVEVPPEPMDAQSPLTIYYTSGTTGRPKGLWHTHGGYVVGLNWAFRALMDPKPEEPWWTVSELGWPVWPMANLYVIPVIGLTGVLFEGTVGHRKDAFAHVVSRFGVKLVWSSTTSLYTMKTLGEESVAGTNLRMILNTGETLNPGAWKWLTESLPETVIGEAYWMTEHLLPIAGTAYGLGEVPFKPGSAGLRFPGSSFTVVDDDGKELPPNRKGYIVLRSVNPSMARMWNDPEDERLVKTYWSKFPGVFNTGDYGYYDEEGYLFVLGRADDVITSTGERVGTMELEGLVASLPQVAEVAAVGGRDGVHLFVVARPELKNSAAEQIREHCRNSGFLVTKVHFVSRLPKTKSGKIMRRLMRSLLNGEDPGDVSTLDDPRSLEEIKSSLNQ